MTRLTPPSTVTTLGVVVALLLATSLAARAQPADKVYRIGMLESVEAAANTDNLDAFRHGLRELGYEEGQHYTIEYRSADDRAERFTRLAAELARLEVDVIVTRGEPAAMAAKRTTRTIPIVMATSGDPAVTGIVASLARPGGNVTGLHMSAPPELGGKRLQLLRETIPAISRVGVLWNPNDLNPALFVRATERVAQTLRVQFKSLELQRGGTFEQAFGRTFEEALFGQVDAVITVEDYVMFSNRARIVDFAAMSRLPAMYPLREFVDSGGLMSYGTDRRDLFRRAATYVHRIFRGARPADLPVEPPKKFELAINLKTAKALGLTIPPSVLQRADYLVQ